MYLGFSSPDLDPNQITDYLMRVVHPKLSAINGVQRADILGDRTFAMRIWLKPDSMAAHGISPTAVREALARNNYLSALGSTKGSMVSVNLVANTSLQTPEEFRQLVVKEQDGVVVRLGDIADVVLGAENYEEDVRFNGETRDVHGHLGPAHGQFARRHRTGARGASRNRGAGADRNEGRRAV
jgi:multidrug efflux pump